MTFVDYWANECQSILTVAIAWGEHPMVKEALEKAKHADCTNSRIAEAATRALLTAYRWARHSDTRDAIERLLGTAIQAAATSPVEFTE